MHCCESSEDSLKEMNLPSPSSTTLPTRITLKNGISIPRLAFGMYKIPEDRDDIIQNAIEVGYRHFDTATFYKNETTLGRAIAASGVPRQEFIICSKVWNDAQKTDRVRESVEETLANLQTDYVDLFLIHWPVPGFFVRTYKVLEELHSEGKIRGIGLSNFSQKEYEELKRSGWRVEPVIHQFEFSPVMYRPQLVDFFQKQEGIVVSASKSLHRADCLTQPLLTRIATNHEKTPAQVMLRWGYQHGLVVVVKTSSRERMIENRNILDFELSPHDMTQLDSLTAAEDVEARTALEAQRKSEM